MGPDAARSVRPVGATNRTMVPISVMMRIWLANTYGAMGSDASRPVNPIDTSRCAARLAERECAKCNHDGEHWCTIFGEALCRVTQFSALLILRLRHYCISR